MNKVLIMRNYYDEFCFIILPPFQKKRVLMRVMRKKLQKQSFADILQRGVLKSFANFTRKHLCWRSLFNKTAGLKAWNFIKKRLQHKFFSVKFAKLFKNTFFYRTPPVAASEIKYIYASAADLLHIKI